MKRDNTPARHETETTFDVSDHAVLRYIERVCGVDIDSIRQHIHSIINADMVDFAEGKTLRYRTADCTFVIKNNVVITTVIKEIS